MSRPFEREIQIVWKSRGSADAAAEVLMKRWVAGGLLPEEISSVGFFLLRTGHAGFVLKRLSVMSLEGAPLNWELLAESLSYLKSPPSKTLMDQILVGVSYDDAVVKLTRSKGMDKWDERIPRLREKANALKAQALVEHKSQMLSQLKILQNDRLFEQEEELLHRISKTFPDDKTVLQKFRHVAERRARELIEARRSQGQKIKFHLERPEREVVPDDVRLALTELAPTLLDRAQNEPEAAYDIAISLLLMDFPEEARQILAFAPKTPSSQWLELELLLETGRSLEALDLCEKLGSLSDSDPDAEFSLMYARSRALWGMGHTAEAMGILQSILRIRPHFRSARSLLMEWKEKLA